MSGGVVQLVATGAQDEWLTGKPEVSFYRSNYKRHTHYSASAERQIIQGTPLPGGISTIRFEKKGDLMNYVYFIGKDSTGATVPGVDWSKVIDKLELLIGGQVIDTQDMTWITQVEPVPGAQNYSTRYLNTNPTGLTNVINGFLPLKFFFCKDWSSSLPLVALQFHDVEIRITWSNNLNYRVNYEIYSTSYSAAGISTALSVANPITGSTVITSTGFMSVTINNGSLSQISTYQSNPFTYSNANFQLVPGMQFYSSTAGAILGSTFLTVISVSPSSSTSGTFIATFQTAPNASSLAPTPVSAYSTAYNQTNAVMTGGCVGAPAAVTAATAPAAGYTAAYTSVTATGYLTPGMSCTNLPGSAGTGYVTDVTVSSGAITGFTVAFAASTTTTTISTGIYGFSAPAASQAARLTYSSGTGSAAITYAVANSGGGSSTIIGGQIYVGQILAAGVSGTTTFGAVTTVNLTNGYVTSIVVTYAGNQAPTAPAVDTVLSQAPSVTITSTAYASGSGSAQVVYNTVVIPATSYLTFGMSISGLPGYNGVGYINALNSTTPGSQTGFSVYFPLGVTTSTTAIPAGTVALAPLGSIQSTTTATTIPNVPIYGIGGIAGSATPLSVNSIISNGALTGGASPVTGVTFYQISAISYQSAGVALATITALGAVTNGIIAAIAALTAAQQVLQTATAVTFSPYFPVLNLLLGSQPTLPITIGMTVGGMVVGQFANIPMATVSNVYTGGSSQTLVAINTNLLLTSASSALTPTVSTENGYYASAALTLSFIPTTFLTGVVTSSTTGFTSGTFTQAGGTSSAATVGQLTQNGALTTTASQRGASVYIPAGMSGVASPSVLTNPYVSASAASTLTLTYSAATTTQIDAQYCQFAIIPQAQIQAQLTALGQPQVDRQGTAIISLQNINSAIKTVGVGMAVLGTQYTGPVTVSQVLATNGTFAGSGTATIEIQFPVQSLNSNTTSAASTGIQFIDPTLPLPAGMTVSTTGFNGTYQQLQYEAWCNFVYLDQKERDFFAKTTQDMLITQVQRISIQNATYQEISIAQPVKYIAFLSNNYATAYQQSQTAGYPAATSYYLKTQINGVDVGDSRSMLQWQDVTQYYHTPYGYNHMGYVAPVALIPYCLDTSKLQPTGTLNFSRLDTYRVVAPVGSTLLQLSGGAAYFYAVNYNILRIQKGLGGLLYAN